MEGVGTGELTHSCVSQGTSFGVQVSSKLLTTSLAVVIRVGRTRTQGNP